MTPPTPEQLEAALIYADMFGDECDRILAAGVRALQAQLRDQEPRWTEWKPYVADYAKLEAENTRLRQTACEYDCKCARNRLCRVHESIVGPLDTTLANIERAVSMWGNRDHSQHIDPDTKEPEPFERRKGRALQDMDNRDAIRRLLNGGAP